jgi:CelD/BcsL family acetyltransferase involved in cellulose biosynthesis
MPAVCLDVQILKSARDLETLESEWARCYEADPSASPYSSYEWIHCLAHTVLSEQDLRVCIVREKNRVVSVIPLVLARKKFILPYTGIKLAEIPYLQWAADRLTTGNTAIIIPELRERPIVSIALSRILQNTDHFSFVRLDKIPLHDATSPCYTGKSTGSNLQIDTTAHFRTDVIPVGRGVVIELPDSWTAYRSTLSPRQKRHITQQSKEIRKAGGACLVRLGLNPGDDTPALSALIEDALAISRKSWQGNASFGTAISDDSVADFVRAVSHRLAHRGALDISVLYLNGEPISFVWGAARWPLTTISKLGFDPAYRKLSPGAVHIAMLIQDSVKRGGTAIDFGHEFPEYKLKWGQLGQALVNVNYYRPTILSSIVRWIRGLKKTHNPSLAIP